MNPLQRAAKTWIIWAIAGALSGVVSGVAHGAENQLDTTKAVPCGVVKDTQGEVEFLNEARTKIDEAVHDGEVACGHWITTGKNAFVLIQHRHGVKFRVGPDSFVQVIDPDQTDAKGPNTTGDQLVLYRGQIYSQSEGGSEEFRILTANGRSRLKRGATLTVYDRDSQHTQLIALEGTTTLENRFRPEARQKISAGEASSIHYELQRVVPTLPESVSGPSLSQKLLAMHLPESEFGKALKNVKFRHEHKVMASLEEFDRYGNEKKDRGTASVPPTPVDSSAYARHPASVGGKKRRAQGPDLKAHLMERVSGQGGRGRAPASVKNEDEEDQRAQQHEKQRLLEELSKVREEP